MKLTKLLALSILLICNQVSAAQNFQQARFERWLTTIEQSLTSSTDIHKIATTLIDGGARTAAFNLQALGKLYKPFNGFSDLRSAFKSLEDAIGEYDKWTAILEYAIKNKKSKKEIEKLEKKRDEALTEFIDFLEAESWVIKNGVSQIQAQRNFLESVAWSNYSDDKTLVLTRLEEQIQSVEDAKWDLSRLEFANGLHELRRELRWIAIESRVLNGLVTYNKKNKYCPIKKFKGLIKQEIAKSIYAQLPVANTETDPCYISQCLFLAIMDLHNQLGDLKSEAETYNNTNSVPDVDVVPAGLVQSAEKILQTLQSTELLRELRNEIKSCY